MMLSIPAVISAEQLRQCRETLAAADWPDGRATAGYLATRVKHNRQLAPDDPLMARIGDLLVDALAANPAFISAALPLKVLPPRFNRYGEGDQYGNHVDNSVLSVRGAAVRIRTDISATLFLSEPDEYDGGVLVVEDSFGRHDVKLPAGHLILYPGTSLHRVTPVTRGLRFASFFWIQSLVRNDADRSLLLELDTAIQKLALQLPDTPQLAQLTGVYHNLLRRWAET
ncbi:MAG: Fe2+-dependent dioxygenase [Woeseia sp.]